MHRRLSLIGKAALAFTLLAGVASASRAATTGSVYLYGGVQMPDSSLMSVYVSGSKWAGGTKGTIAFYGPAGRVNSYIHTMEFPTSNTAVAYGDLFFVKNGVKYAARVRVEMTSPSIIAQATNRGSMRWTVFSLASGATLWSSDGQTAAVSELPLISGTVMIAAR
jgi:hypothetical protein